METKKRKAAHEDSDSDYNPIEDERAPRQYRPTKKKPRHDMDQYDKAQARKTHNKKAAATYRKKKKRHLLELQRKIQELQQNNKTLNAAVADLLQLTAKLEAVIEQLETPDA